MEHRGTTGGDFDMKEKEDVFVGDPGDPADDVESDGAVPAQMSDTEMARTNTNVSIAETLSPLHEFSFVTIVCMAQLMTQVGLAQTLAILHVIGDSFGIKDPGQLSWLIAGYSLTAGTFLLIAGRFGDVFGHKKMFIIGFSWFSLWSMVAGLSYYSNSVLFTFARAFQGLGPAIVLPNGLALLGATYAQGPRKDMVFALFGACAPGGGITGAVFASLFALKSWPWTFYSFSLALAGVAILGGFIIPDPRVTKDEKKYTMRERISQLDLVGGTVGVLALVLFNFAWNQAPIQGWQEPYIIVILILGILLAVLFFRIEIHHSSSPLIPFEALTVDVLFVMICVACGWSSFGIWIYYTYQFLQLFRGASPLLATAEISPVAVSGFIASITTGLILGRIRPAWVMTFAMLAFTVGITLIGTAPVDQIYWKQAFFCVIIIPWGMDMSFPASAIIFSNSVSKEHQGIAASLIATVINYSISLGLGFAGTVDVHLNNGGKTQSDILKGFRGAFWMGMGLAGLGLMTSVIFLIKTYWQDRKKPTSKS